MIYRIKHVKDGKFVRYATDEEIKYLRVNANGKVERLTTPDDSMYDDMESYIVKHNAFISSKWEETEYSYGMTIYHYWQDVSDTHEVEWGLSCIANEEGTERMNIYENDIVAFYNKNGVEEERHQAIRMDFDVCVENDCEFQSRYSAIGEKIFFDACNVSLKVIGNANETELLEVK